MKLGQAEAYVVRLEATLQKQTAAAENAAVELERLRSDGASVEVSAARGLAQLRRQSTHE